MNFDSIFKADNKKTVLWDKPDLDRIPRHKWASWLSRNPNFKNLPDEEFSREEINAIHENPNIPQEIKDRFKKPDIDKNISTLVKLLKDLEFDDTVDISMEENITSGYVVRHKDTGFTLMFTPIDDRGDDFEVYAEWSVISQQDVWEGLIDYDSVQRYLDIKIPERDYNLFDGGFDVDEEDLEPEPPKDVQGQKYMDFVSHSDIAQFNNENYDNIKETVLDNNLAWLIQDINGYSGLFQNGQAYKLSEEDDLERLMHIINKHV